MLEASASPSSTPSCTRPTPVSSQEVSIPRTMVTLRSLGGRERGLEHVQPLGE
jgi:hypothetical protein